MPTLNWIGKDAVIRHHKDVPFRLLEPDEKLSHGDGDDGNLIVQGDNLHALKALLPKYAGKVKCIYIDPPYNTGNVGWIYNDDVKAPEIKKWLGQVVGKESEDLSRHDKWLCMMYPRLVLLKQFLSKDGSIFVSIDDNEVASLRLLMDEIFGRDTFITQISWQKVYTLKNTAAQFSEMHDHIIVHAKEGVNWRPNHLKRTDKQNKAYTNPDKDVRGAWKATPVHARNHYDDGKYKITSPSGNDFYPPSGTSWRFSESNFLTMQSENRIWWGKNGDNIPSKKSFLSEVKDGIVASSMWFHDEAGHNAEAKNELRDELGGLPDELLTPKPTRLIQRILQIASDKDSIILDSFAGSGTTANAVLKQNAEDGGNRKFILCEMEQNIAEEITSERVRRVAGGYTNAKGEEIAGLGGGFQYCRLSEEPLFNEFGDIRDDVSFDQLADFVWFAETGIGYTEARDRALLGEHDGIGIYLLFNGILGDRRPKGGNILTHQVLEALPEHTGEKVIYAAASQIGDTALRRLGITFKQTPYSIQV